MLLLLLLLGRGGSLAKLVDSVTASNSETMLGGIGLAEGVIDVLDFLGGQVITHFAIVDAFDKTHDE